MAKQTVSYKPAGAVAAAFHRSDAFVRGLMGPVGCVSGATEYLSRMGWRAINQYAGEEVAVWNDGRVSFETPGFVNADCESLIRFDSGSLVMELSDEHRVLNYSWDGKLCVLLASYLEQHPGFHHIPTTFGLERQDHPITDDEIRFRVMFSADGHVPNVGRKVSVCVRKERKKTRIREILSALGVEWTEHRQVSRPTEVTFRFVAPIEDKSLAFVWGLSSRQLEIVVSECLHWDGLCNHAEKRYYTTAKENADAIQFAAHAIGYRAAIHTETDTRSDNWKPLFVVAIRNSGSAKNNVAVGGHTRITRIPAREKYCFTTSTGFWVARCEGTVFITGNSSKSSACWMEIFTRAAEQRENEQGVRRTRVGVVRNTYPELISTTIKTVLEWCPFMKMNWSSPITGRVYRKLNDGTTMDMEVVFIALERPEEIDKIGSLELTFAWANEVREVAKPVFDKITERVGRFPPKRDGGATWKGVVIDTNPPDDDSWYYKLAERADPEMTAQTLDAEKKLRALGLLKADQRLYEFFHQPGGLMQTSTGYEANPDAENIENLDDGYGYYFRQLAGKRPEWVRAQILGQYATSTDGKPVYPEYSDEMHCRECAPMHNQPLLVGLDYGRNPAAAICQITPRGQLRFIDECWADDTGLETFAEDVLKPHLARNCRGYDIVPVGDPAGIAKESDERSAFDVLAECGIVAVPAHTNKLTGRLEAVRHFLGRMVDGQPALIVDPKCVRLRKGFIGRYHFKRVQTSGERFKDVPEKDLYSHIHDAGQYAALYARLESVNDAKFKTKINYPSLGIV